MPVWTAEPAELQRVFETLKPLLKDHEHGMIVVHDTPRQYYLNTRTIMENGQPLFFGSVEIRKNYVSFHLFPVYVFPELLDGIGGLKKRMQGKSCFNFRKIDQEQVGALRSLVRAGNDRFRQEGLVG